MTDLHKIVQRQFDKQALNFSSWSVTKNKEHQEAYFHFCEIVSQDILLDFACGTGDYAIAAAPRVKYAYGVDISKGMIEVAKRQAEELNVKNVNFLCYLGESTSFEEESFSIIIYCSASSSLTKVRQRLLKN
jgi:ubiquinone/menaquinone biosynthesis C-methylase UbiE